VSVPETRIDIRVPPDQRPAPKTAKLPEPPEREGRGDRDSNNTVQTVNHNNSISTPALVICTGLVLLAIALSSYENHLSNLATAAQSAAAVGIANQAERQAQNAEREARLSMDKEEIDASNIAVNKALIESYGIAKIVQQEKAK